jgi:hypothetical protein
LARSSAARTERDGSQDFVEASDGFRDACEAFGRAAEVAITTGAALAPPGNGGGDGATASG